MAKHPTIGGTDTHPALNVPGLVTQSETSRVHATPNDDAPALLSSRTWGEQRAALRAAGRLHGPAGAGGDGWTVKALDLLGYPLTPGAVVDGVEGPRRVIRVTRSVEMTEWGSRPKSGTPTWRDAVPVEMFGPELLWHTSRQAWPRVVEMEHTGERWEYPTNLDGTPDESHDDAFVWQQTDRRERIRAAVSGWCFVVGGEEVYVPVEFGVRIAADLAGYEDVSIWLLENTLDFSANSTLPDAVRACVLVYAMAKVPTSLTPHRGTFTGQRLDMSAGIIGQTIGGPINAPTQIMNISQLAQLKSDAEE